MIWSTAAPAMASAFLASTVEVVEALTIVLVVAMLRGWKPAATGVLAALAVLAAIIVGLGPLLGRVPLHALQLAIGVLLLLFGLGWLRKAILRAAGVLALHDEAQIYERERRHLDAQTRASEASADWIAGLAAFKAVLLEGIEVVFIVLAVGAGRGLLWPAALGALAACLAVLGLGALVHRPLTRVPENTLKFAIGVMLSSFGVFWTGEGLGVAWPGADLSLLALVAIFLLTGVSTTVLLRRSAPEPAS